MNRKPIFVPRKTIVGKPCGYIYLTTCKVNHKLYVGKHQRSEFDTHYFGSGVILEKALRKYGLNNFTCEVIDVASSVEELNEKEKFWIKFLGTQNTKVGYNIMGGGEGYTSEDLYGAKNPMYGRTGVLSPRYGKHNTKHANELLSKFMKNRIKEQGSLRTGTKHSEKTKQQISKNKMGDKNPASIKVVQLTLKGEFVKEYDSMGVAAQELGHYDHSGISHCCRGIQKTTKGFKWMYKEDYEKMIQEKGSDN